MDSFSIHVPSALTVLAICIYVADTENHRVQVFTAPVPDMLNDLRKFPS